MPKGGHARSGPAKTPGSRSSERAGYTMTALPNEGYRGMVPDLSDFLPDVTDRHGQVWAELWSTPQACMWSQARWYWPIAADLVRWMVRADEPDAPIGLATAIRQLRDDLGLSKAGLDSHGWSIATAEIAPGEPVDETPAEGDEVGERRQKRLR